jgi:hypothetical protein
MESHMGLGNGFCRIKLLPASKNIFSGCFGTHHGTALRNKGARAQEFEAWLGNRGKERSVFRKLWVSLLFKDNLCAWEVPVHLSSLLTAQTHTLSVLHASHQGAVARARAKLFSTQNCMLYARRGWKVIGVAVWPPAH